MNERVLSAINKLNDKVDSLDKQFNTYKENDVRNNVAAMSSKLDRYSIKDGEWMYGGYPTGETAVGPQGPKGEKGDKGDKGDSFTFDDLTPEQVALITGADGLDGKDGKDGKPGKDGKDGIDGRPGKDGKDGKDGITPELEIGNIKSVSTYDPAKVSLRKKKDKYVIDMDIPRGRPGANGADGGNGISAKINGQSTINIEAGTNIRIDQQGETLTINSTGGGGGGTSDYEDLDNLPSINNVELKGNKTSSDLGLQPAGNYVTNTDYATNDTGGVIKVSTNNGFSMTNGNLRASTITYENYLNAQNNTNIGKATLENVIAGKGLVISSSLATVATSGDYNDLINKPTKTKTITENDIRWHNGWKDCYNGTQLNLDVSGTGRMSMTPLWIIEGTILNVNTSFYTQANTASGTKAYVDIELYKPSDVNANAYGWVKKVRKYMDTQGNYTIDETGYYVISVFNCTASNNPLKDYGKPYTFSYTVEEDLEVNYVNTVDWKVKDIVFVINGNTQSSFSNGLNWVCRREIGQPYYLSISGAASEHDMGCYSYNTNDFSGTRSSTSRQAIFVYNDEIWYFAPSLDGHVGIASISKFKIYDNNWIEYVGHCWHNLGHMNSVGYEKSTDVFIWGNGSSSYSQEGEGYIINNFSNSKLATSYNDEIVLISDMDVDTGNFPKATYGFKVNVIPFSASCNNNSAPYNLYVAMATNDGNTFRIGKITANSSSKYLWENCVWENAINVGDVTETTTESYEHCIQGMAVLNGHIIMGEGHTKPQITTIWNDTFATMRTSCLLQQFSDSSITCVAVFDNKLVYCSSYEWIFTDITSLNNGISENRINELIENSIGNAIGGSY